MKRHSRLLTEKQFEAIATDFDQLDASERSRLRDRIINVLQDFTTLNRIPSEEIEKIFEKGFKGNLNMNYESDVEDRFVRGLLDLHVFIWVGLRTVDWSQEDYEELFEAAIERAEQGGLPLAGLWTENEEVINATVDIEIERSYKPSLSEIQSKLEEGDELTDEQLGRAAKEIPREELRELVNQHMETENYSEG